MTTLLEFVGRSDIRELSSQIVTVAAYDEILDEYTCQNGKKLKPTYTGIRKSKSNYESIITYYECEDCSDCPYKKKCTKAKGNRKMQVSKKFIEQRKQSLERITSEKRYNASDEPFHTIRGSIWNSETKLRFQTVFTQRKQESKD